VIRGAADGTGRAFWQGNLAWHFGNADCKKKRCPSDAASAFAHGRESIA
jgi:hypothetical protein